MSKHHERPGVWGMGECSIAMARSKELGSRACGNQVIRDGRRTAIDAKLSNDGYLSKSGNDAEREREEKQDRERDE